MSCPLGETGVGKMGETPPQEVSTNAAARRPSIGRARATTEVSISVAGRRPWRAASPPLIESKIDCGGTQEAPIRRCIEPQPDRRMSQLRSDHRAVSRPLSQLRLQAPAVEPDG